ncbi:MAG: hypothetical protein SVY53_01295 [Chloroflexota bacterium]|nr:hypothetical protein [Chloroflexota bacterium]
MEAEGDTKLFFYFAVKRLKQRWDKPLVQARQNSRASREADFLTSLTSKRRGGDRREPPITSNENPRII